MQRFFGSPYFRKESIITSVLVGLLCIFLFKEGARFLYQADPSAKVVHSGNYYLSKSALNENYDSDSFLFPYHIYLMRLDLSPEDFKRYCGFIIFGAAGFLASWVARKRGAYAAAFLGFFLLFSPVFLIQSVWIGFSDHLNFLFLVGLVIRLDSFEKGRERYWPLVPIFILGSWNHFYQFHISAALTIGVYFAKTKRIDPKLIAFSLSGSLIGKVSSWLLFQSQNVEIVYRREKVLQASGLGMWVAMHSSKTLSTILSFFHGLAFLFIENLFRKDWIVLSLFLFSAVVTFFTADTTRVFVNLFYPPWILYWLLRFRDMRERREKLLLSLLLLLAAIYTLTVSLYYKWGSEIVPLRGN